MSSIICIKCHLYFYTDKTTCSLGNFIDLNFAFNPKRGFLIAKNKNVIKVYFLYKCELITNSAEACQKKKKIMAFGDGTVTKHAT